MLEPRPNRDSLPWVLVVDDDPSIRRSLARLFKAAGLNVESFDSARAFLERVPQPVLDKPFDVDVVRDLLRARLQARER